MLYFATTVSYFFLPGLLQAVLKMLNEIGTVENIPEFIEGVKNRYFVLYLIVSSSPTAEEASY